MQVHHIGYLVKRMNNALSSFEYLGYRRTGAVFYDEGRDAELCFLESAGGGKICVELVSPRRTSPLYGLLKAYKNTAYHICYRVDSIREEVARMEQNGYRMFRESEPAPAIGENASVAFLMSPDIGMVELLEIRQNKNQISKE